MGKRLALIIGNSWYRDSTLARLQTPDVDVGALAETLLDPEVGAFDDAKVLVNMSSAAIRRAISDFFAKKSREDLLLLYFSGHGVLDERGRLYLALKDSDHTLLRGTALAASFIADEMDNSRSQRQVLILDCCHSGAFGRGAKGAAGLTVGTGTAFEGTGYGRVVLTATDATQYAWEGERILGQAGTSLFTHYLIAGLQNGQADADQDGRITVNELYEYVYREVVRQTPQQTPGKWSYKEQGEIVLARAASGGAPILPSLEALPPAAPEDPERQRRVEELYTRGLSAYWLAEWQPAARAFQELLELEGEYRDAGEKLGEALRQLHLQELYQRAEAALEAGDYGQAEALLEALVGEAPGYKEAASKLETARRKRQVGELLGQAEALHRAGEWQAVLQVFERIGELEPDYADPQGLRESAQAELEAQKRQAEIESQYRQALERMNAGQWPEARQILAQIQARQPDYADTGRLLARVEAEIERQQAQRQIEARVAALYEQASELSRQGDWRPALEKMEEIESLVSRIGDREDMAITTEVLRLVREEQYEPALAQLEELRSRVLRHPRRQNVLVTVQKKLTALSKPWISKFERSSRLRVEIGGALLFSVLVAILLLIPKNKAPIVVSPGSISASSVQNIFMSNRDGKPEIYRMSSKGEVIRVTHSPGNAESWDPVLDPNGQTLFTSNRDGKNEIYRMNPKGEVIRVTYSPGNAQSWRPVLHPSGWIYFTSDRDGKPEIYRMDSNSQITRVTHSPDGAESGDLAVDANGQILFTSNRDGKHEIYRLNSKSEVIRITHSPGGSESWGPVPDPNGQILFTSNRDGKYEIYRMNAKGEVIRVTHSPDNAESWDPVLDSNGQILFTSNRNGNREIYRMNSKGEAIQVTHSPGSSESWLN